MLDRTDRSKADRPFLKATWSHLCIVTFAISPELLEEDVPEGLELVTRDGDAFVSLVAFDFEDTKVWGIGWPGFRNFPEVDFRYYVTDGQRRGVSFIREFVPQPFVAWMAGVFYHEPYESTPMESDVTRDDDGIAVEHRWTYGGKENRLTVKAHAETETPDDSADDHLFREPQWGFGADGDGETLAYEVRHPTWETYPVRSLDYEIDWSGMYGQKWKPLEGREPISIALAEGSPIEVFANQASDDDA